MKKWISLFVLTIILNYSSNAQSPSRPIPEYPTLKDRIVYGGGLWLFFVNFTELEILPLVGYRVTDRLSVLGGPTYSYYNDRRFNFISNSYGARILGRFFLNESIYLQGEADYLSFGIRDIPYRLDYTYLLAGAGLYNRGSTIELLFITNNPVNSRYNVPFLLRFGYIFYANN